MLQIVVSLALDMRIHGPRLTLSSFEERGNGLGLNFNFTNDGVTPV